MKRISRKCLLVPTSKKEKRNKVALIKPSQPILQKKTMKTKVLANKGSKRSWLSRKRKARKFKRESRAFSKQIL